MLLVDLPADETMMTLEDTEKRRTDRQHPEDVFRSVRAGGEVGKY